MKLNKNAPLQKQAHSKCSGDKCKICHPQSTSQVRSELELFREKISQLVDKNSEKAATILTSWINNSNSHEKS